MHATLFFGEWVKRRRKALDLTQQNLADRAACSVAAIQKIERNERRPSRQLAELLADSLEIPIAQREAFLKAARGERSVERLDLIPSPQAPASAESPAPRLAPNLPAATTPLVGRSPELAQIGRLLHDPRCRLLTLTGPGGIGKTRLAVEVARQQHERFADGAHFVSLAGIDSSELIVPTIADALKFTFAGQAEPKAQLIHYLLTKQVLLLLDNFEHLLQGAVLLSEILAQAPQVKLLVTSREQLHLQAEWTFAVQGLPLPESAQAGELEASSAASLFLQRAQQAHIGFSLADDERPAVMRICQLVEGMPLGIELAAAWVRMLSCREIAYEIERGLDFLTASMRDAPERHRSIRAVFDHSWRLLSPPEQQVMQRLAVFRGGFTRDAAEKVAGASLVLLSALVDKSLVRHDPGGRYDLHELIQQFAAAHLQEDPAEMEAARRRHCETYLALLQSGEAGLRSSRQKDTFDGLKPEIDNIRAAWDFGVAQAEIGLLRRAMGPLYYFYELHQYFQEAETLYAQAAARLRQLTAKLDPPAAPADQARLAGALGGLLAYQAFFNQRLGRNPAALSLYRASLEMLRPLQESLYLGFALVHYGIVSLVSGDFTEASPALLEGLSLSRTLEHPWLQTVALGFLGMLAHEQGDDAAAYSSLSEAMAFCRDMGDPHVTLLTGILFSQTLQAMGRLGEAQDLLHEGLKIARQTDNRWGIGLGLEQMAMLAQSAGDHLQARRWLEQSVALHREVGDLWSLSRALTAQCRLELAQQDLAVAERCALEAFKTAVEVRYNLNALDALASLAEVYARQGRRQPALKLALVLLQHPAAPQNTREHAARLRADLEAHLSPAQIQAARAQAQNHTLESLALEIGAASA